MRLSLWLILILAFSVGMCCAFAVRFLYFEAMPVVVQTAEPKTKILVATRAIPSGIEITAEFVAFQEVPISEVPSGSLTSFAQVYRRQPAYPIPAGCPICEDLLLPQATTASQTAFVPTGNQIVALDVVHIRQGDRLLSPKELLSTVLSADQRIDIRVVPTESQGRLAEKKNEVLRNFASQDAKNSGELVLEDVPIHRIQRQFAANSAGSMRNFLELMLDSSEAARLTAAAKRGQIRILVRQDEKVPPAEAESIFEIADSPTRILPDSLPFEQPLVLDIPLIQEHLPVILAESVSTVPVEHVQRIAPMPADISTPIMSSASTFVALPLVSESEFSQNLDRQPDSSAVDAPPESVIEEIDPIRNEGMLAFGASSFRVISPEQPLTMEQKPTPTRLPSLTADEPGQDALTRPHPPHSFSEVTMGPPRVTNTIQFLPPGVIATVKEHPQEIARQVESAIMPPVMTPVMPPVIPALPVLAQERTPGYGYSPFERRVYTVLPDESTEEGLPPPQQLLRSSDSGTQTK